MKEMLEKIKEQAEKQIAAATSPEALDEIKVTCGFVIQTYEKL